MSLYPKDHQPFIPRGLGMDRMTKEDIQMIANERSLERCLTPAWWDLGPNRYYVEHLRACLFRAEQLIGTQPLPAKDGFILLPHEIPALLESKRQRNVWKSGLNRRPARPSWRHIRRDHVLTQRHRLQRNDIRNGGEHV